MKIENLLLFLGKVLLGYWIEEHKGVIHLNYMKFSNFPCDDSLHLIISHKECSQFSFNTLQPFVLPCM